MGILANTVSVCQYRVLGEVPNGDLGTWAGERLAAQGFRSIDNTSEEMSFGWTQLDDPEDSSFERPEAFWREHYLVFSLRRDQRRVPAALLRSYRERAEADWLAANPGLNRVPKQKREELREAVLGSLLAKTLPTPTVWDVVWDTRSNLIWFANLSPKVTELFEALFKTCFEGLRLLPIYPWARAEQVVDDSLRPALEQADASNTDNVLDKIQDNQWLGWDFLLWLFHQSMEESGNFQVNRPGPAVLGENFVAYLNNRLVLFAGGEEGIQKITVAGPQDRFSEVKSALQGGKQISDATLYLEKGEDLWQLTLKSDLFQFRSLKAPAVKLEKDELTEEGQERIAVFFERMYLLEQGLQLFDSLLSTFLSERLSPQWSAREQTIRQWLEQE